MRDITFCDAEAQDDPRFALTKDTFSPPPGIWAPDCGHPACVEDAALAVAEDAWHPGGWHAYDCPVTRCRYATATAACDLPAGHDGDHSYARPSVGQPAGAR